MNRFVIGIGSQRAGSTLLHHALEASSDIFMHPLKELHYFDTLHGVRSQEALKDFSLRQLGREIDRIVGSEKLDFLDARYRCYVRTNRILGMTPISEVDYRDLYRPFLKRSPLLGEVTPEYMLLGDAAIRAMREKTGEDAVIILVCRNPVRRVCSTIKLFSKYNDLDFDDEQARAWLRRHLETPNPWLQAQDGYNDYAGALDRFTAHFRHVIAITYDTLATAPQEAAQAINALGNLRIDVEKFVAAAGSVRNGLGPGFDLGPVLETELDHRYRDQRERIEQRLGKALVL